MAQEQKFRRLTGLYPRLLMGFIAIIVVIMVMAYIVINQYMYNSIYRQTEQDLLTKVEFIAGRRHVTEDLPVLRKYQAMLNAEIIFVDTDYVAQNIHNDNTTLLNVSDEETMELQYKEIVSQIDKRMIDRIFAGDYLSGVADVDFLTEDIVYAGAPLKDEAGNTLGALMLIRPVKNIQTSFKELFTYVSGMIVVSVAIACILTTLYARSIIMPLRAMNEAANSMAAGDYCIRVPVARHDEIGQMAQTINMLAERLRQVICSLNNEKSKIDKIIFTIVEGIVAFDEAGRVFRSNPAALEMLEICSWERCNSPDARKRKQHVVDLLQSCSASGKTEKNTWVNPSGRTILALATPVKNDEQTVIGSVCLLRDVSEEQRLEQLRREYIANVSHELRTPLTGIRGMVEPLLDDVLETEEEKKESVRIIYKETLRLEKLISEMLELSRLQDGNSGVELEPVQIATALGRAAYSMRALAEEAGIEMTVSAADDIIAVGDENRIVQTLLTLIDNAISFTPTGGKVTISARQDENKVYVSVKDTGVGIEPQHVPYIWERFYKADKSRLRTTGTGLGLAIAKRGVELMNGEISVQTEEGKGAEFTFSLQRCRQNPE